MFHRDAVAAGFTPVGAMRRACITGGAGFIGSNLADRLRAERRRGRDRR